MRDLNRFEYLQLAAALMPEESKPLNYDVLAHELFELAKAIEVEYQARYRYDESDSFKIQNHLEGSNNS
ncbi:hypothetical protein BKK47_07530 [Rodentibacter mrazii]|uniref:Uncharacterized protein n=1 Tax=Rodentibacter mrazii TaxID=1908257 RepID=A0A1V3IEG6_9PAST|nr:hypothetical protein [Rodentibacter mrazii]OOF39060.1 hypothetical protein BKK47_07530 [Rodentibacter mrazii]